MSFLFCLFLPSLFRRVVNRFVPQSRWCNFTLSISWGPCFTGVRSLRGKKGLYKRKLCTVSWNKPHYLTIIKMQGPLLSLLRCSKLRKKHKTHPVKSETFSPIQTSPRAHPLLFPEDKATRTWWQRPTSMWRRIYGKSRAVTTPRKSRGVTTPTKSRAVTTPTNSRAVTTPLLCLHDRL
jgi:hypothetical protein